MKLPNSFFTQHQLSLQLLTWGQEEHQGVEHHLQTPLLLPPTTCPTEISTRSFSYLVDDCSKDLFFCKSLAAALAGSVDCYTRPKKPSFTNPPSALGCTKAVLTVDPPSALGCVAKAALTEFPTGLAEGRCSSRAGANVPEELDAAIVAAFLTFTGSPFLTPKKLRVDSLSSCSSPNISSFDQSKSMCLTSLIFFPSHVIFYCISDACI
jgi:hypothetical protein